MATRKRILRSPIEPGSVQISLKALLSMIPLLLMLLTLAGNWYLMRDKIARFERLEAKVQAIELSNAASGDDHSLLLKMADDLNKLKRRAGID